MWKEIPVLSASCLGQERDTMRRLKKMMIVAAAAAMFMTGAAGCSGCNKETVSQPTGTPAATEKPVEVTKIPELTPEATPEPELTGTPELTEAVTPKPAPESTPAPTAEPELTATAALTPTAVLEMTPAPTVIPEPTETPMPTVTPEPTLAPTPTPTPVPVKGIVAGDYVTFGSYEQDSDLSNGKEPIEWLVLEAKDGKAFLLSKYVLDGRPYDTNFDLDAEITAAIGGKPYSYRATWEKSTIRTWLNEEFYNTAFNSSEQESILLSHVENLPNSLRGTSSGPDTKDKVYLLSESEVIKYFGKKWVIVDKENRYIWEDGVYPEQDIQLGVPTEYAVRNGVYKGGAGTLWSEEYCSWSLRTTGGPICYTVYMCADGFLQQDGGNLHGIGGVRPALWLDITSADVEKVK